ncbi:MULTISPECIES: hypothetical protein [Pseudodesulfovibrio]|uniref:Uncharacterized protein n=1 Tax=Pseudodesulfovibrio aespoeensis (strain ATCC 700646 / DSM 10631 / Aspo-2) TaxID=643562 RepID=E6VQM9_PSEA9|nr:MULTISPECIES: hypothetical protein [Pseudodesulfovibrio]ADU61756.1 hypothetical protein Daes_0739 [Pseudodesulfovibrio aespoeensis Aspo-2]MCG2732671.1 hypothetical protein [Pseudodesulfovibrio aespoeensis]
MDTNFWLGLIALTCALYMLKWFQGRRKVTVYRISPASLRRSKEVMLRVLPLVEDGRDCPLDVTSLPWDKATIKGAAKILAYHFWRENQHEELIRIKQCFVSLARFQNRDLDFETCERLLTRERERLVREIDCYLTHASSRKG